MHSKRQMLYSANEIMCNTLKVKICLNIKLEMCLHGMMISYLTGYIMERKVNTFQMFLRGKQINFVLLIVFSPIVYRILDILYLVL